MISLVSTVLNDRSGVMLFFEQMALQTLQSNEIIIVDGGSTDGTWELLQQYSISGGIPLRCYQEKDCNVARGRNLAIEHATYDTIVSTDIGCGWDKEWLEELVRPLLDEPSIEVVMGSWTVRWEDLESDWARIDYLLNGGLTFRATPQAHASSRSIAYRKQLWEKVGGYPEDLTLAGDDMVFALLIHKFTKNVACAPIPRCYWERPTTLKSFCKEAKRNFFGGGEAGIWLSYGFLVGSRLILELFLLIAILTLLILQFTNSSLLGLTLTVLMTAFFVFGYRIFQLIKRSRESHHLSPALIIKLISFVYSIKLYSLIGYWTGFFRGKLACHQCRQRLRAS